MSESKALAQLSNIHATCLRELESFGNGVSGDNDDDDDRRDANPKETLKKTSKAIKSLLIKRFDKLESPPDDHEEVFTSNGLKYTLSRNPKAFVPITEKWIRERLAHCLLASDGAPSEFKTDEQVEKLCNLVFSEEYRPLKKPSFKFKIEGEDLVKLGVKDDDDEGTGDDQETSDSPKKRRKMN